jgi:hypothetical protein
VCSELGAEEEEGTVSRDCSEYWASIACVPRCGVKRTYSEDEIRALWRVYLIPAIMGLVSCVLILLAWNMGKKKSHKDYPKQIVMLATLGVLYAAIDTVPVLVLYTDLPCVDDTWIGSGTSAVCQINELSTHILQMEYYLVGSLLSHVYNTAISVKSAKAIKRIDNVAIAGSILLPFVAGLATIIQPFPNCYSRNHEVNSERMQFRCQPSMPEMWHEWLVVHLHFIFGGSIILGFVMTIVKHSLKLSAMAATDRSKSTKDGKGYFTYFCGALFGTIFKSSLTRLFMMGLVCVVLLVLTLYVNLSTIVQLERWLEVVDQFDVCLLEAVNLGIAPGKQRDACLVFEPPNAAKFVLEDERVAHSTLLLGNFSISLAVFVFPTFFALDQRNTRLWKKLLGSRFCYFSLNRMTSSVTPVMPKLTVSYAGASSSEDI